MKKSGIKSLKRLFLLATFSSFVYNAQAQEKKSKKLSVGVNCGLTKSNIKSFPADGVVEHNLPDETQKFTLGYYYGASVNYKLKDRFVISTGLNYMVNKIDYTIPDVLFQRADSVWLNANGRIKNNTHTLYIPLQVSYLLNKKTNTPFVTVGTALNFYLGTKEKNYVYNDADDSELATSESKYRLTDYMGRNFCVAFGGGYNYQLTEKFEAKAMAIYNMSTAKVLNKDLNVNVNHRINFIQLGLCLNYNL